MACMSTRSFQRRCLRPSGHAEETSEVTRWRSRNATAAWCPLRQNIKETHTANSLRSLNRLRATFATRVEWFPFAGNRWFLFARIEAACPLHILSYRRAPPTSFGRSRSMAARRPCLTERSALRVCAPPCDTAATLINCLSMKVRLRKRITEALRTPRSLPTR